MKALLIIFMTFHFEATTVSTETIEFSTMHNCEKAKEALKASVARPDVEPGMGRRGLVAVCVEA